jgi:thiol-disulfide isomerase/thioredoxin
MRREWIAILILIALGLGVLIWQSPDDVGPARTGDPSKVTLIPADSATLKKEVQAHKGKVVLVEFWATWCENCRRDFPKFVDIHEKYSERGVVCISVAREKRPEDDREYALSFLKARHATMTNFLFDDEEGPRELRSFFGYPGMIPYQALFGKNGNRIVPEDGEHFSTLELLSRIESELAK